jgi:molybdopterin molybdotransferase
MTPPLPLEEAQARLLNRVEPLSSETVPIHHAVGRWLTSAVIARRTSPEADLSAMDGYATAGPAPWRVVGESAAGRPWLGPIGVGEAARISTGAHLPHGAEAILPVEDAVFEGDFVTANGSGPSASYIRRAGFDFAAGETVLPPGTRIGPAQLALALAAGAGVVQAGRLPRVAIIDTGDELAPDGAQLCPGLVPATNGPMLAAMCEGLAATIARIGPVPDDRARLHAAFEEAGEADLIVTSGGASVGDHDLVRPVLETWGADIAFWRVAIRPGKPLLVARRGTQYVIGLPGNPASAFVTAHLFVLPMLRRLAGASSDACLPSSVPAILGAATPAGGARREFLRGQWTADGVLPLPERDSSAVRTLARANVLIDRPAMAPAARIGDVVQVLPLFACGGA